MNTWRNERMNERSHGPPQLASPFQFSLYRVKLVRLYDRRVAALNEKLWHLAFVFLHLLREEIHGEFLLQQRIAAILLVPQDRPNRGDLPNLLAAGG